MRLAEWMAKYALDHDLCPKYVLHLYTCQRSFDRWSAAAEVVKRAVPIEEITVEHLNGWAEHECTLHSRITVKNKLSTLVTLLRAAADHDPPLRGPLVGKLKRLKVQVENPRAFTPQEVALLIQGAESYPGYFPLTGIKRSDWWLGDLKGGWDLGMRASDMLELEWSHVDEASLIVVKTQHKTGRIHKGRIRPETLEAWRRIRSQGVGPTCPYVLPFVGDRSKFCLHFQRLAKRVGVEGTSKYLRRGGATQIWKLHGPAAAAKYLGHADGTGLLAWRNYIDRSQLDDDLPLPPPIG